MGLFDSLGQAWNGMMADPQKQQQFQQFALALAQSKPDITPFGNIGSAIQRSQDYMMMMRELQRKQTAEAEAAKLERDKLAETQSYHQGALKIDARQADEMGRERRARNAREAASNQTELEKARIAAGADRYAARTRADVTSGKLPAARVQLMNEITPALQAQFPNETPAQIKLRALQATMPPVPALYGTQLTDAGIDTPSVADVAAAQLAALGHDNTPAPAPAPASATNPNSAVAGRPVPAQPPKPAKFVPRGTPQVSPWQPGMKKADTAGNIFEVVDVLSNGKVRVKGPDGGMHIVNQNDPGWKK